MKTTIITIPLAVLMLMTPFLATAGEADFHPGPLIKDYGMIAAVPAARPLPEDAHFKVAIDVVEGGEDDKVNARFVTAASLLNLLNASGVDSDKIEIALVVHGPAYRDLLTDAAYGGSNPNAKLIAALQQYQVQFYYCGQSAVYRDVAVTSLLPGVEVTLSATITHAMLQQQGFALRP